jgi:hypothetical protein
MKRVLLILAIAALALPSSALGKGPSAASIDGPGAGGGITFTGCCSPETPTMMLAEQAGFFPAVFRQQPDPMLDERPRGDLGPKYTITYTVPGPNNETWSIRQDVYPYAKPAAVTYMPPGQAIFETDGTRGGWFQAGPALKQTLVSAGLPASAAGGGSADDSSFPTMTVSVLALALLFVGAAAVLLRRRARPAAA